VHALVLRIPEVLQAVIDGHTEGYEIFPVARDIAGKPYNFQYYLAQHATRQVFSAASTTVVSVASALRSACASGTIPYGKAKL